MTPDLELALRELDVEWPATPDLATAVSARIAAAPPARRRLDGWRRRIAIAVAALGLLFGATMAVSPSARTEVLRWLGLESVEIKREPPRATPGASLNLGTPSTVEDLRARRVPLRVPNALEDEPGVYATRLFDGSLAASLVYDGPILVQTFRASVDRFIQKSVSNAEAVDEITVDGKPGYFITGAHGFAYEADNADVTYEEQRIAGNTLLVEGDGVLLRIEGAISKDRAIEIAESVQ